MMGVLFVISPPQHPMKRGTGWVMLAFFTVTLTAFLPASWFGIPTWRIDLVEAGLALPRTLSPQPSISFDYVALLGAGLLWIYYLSGRAWEKEDRLYAMRAVGIFLLAFTASSLLCHVLQWMPPLWEGQHFFGPIANRNQMALILCLAALVTTGCGYYEFNGRHKLCAAFWATGLPFVFAGLVINGSRAGVLLFFGGLGAWIAVISVKKRSVGTFAVAGSALLLLAATFFLYGGRTLERLKTSDEDLTSIVKGETRFEIFGETLELITVAPFFGTGFGNFAPIYALHRDLEKSSVLSRVAQPDNDWLWLATEAGLVGLVLAILTIVLLAFRAFPLSERKRQSDRTTNLRLSALVCAGLFCVDGLVNIPGHRMAVFLIGALLFALALHSNRRRRTNRLLTPFYRVAGVAVIVVGLAWIGATVTGRVLPGTVGIENLTMKASQAQQDERFEEALDLINRAIRLEPLRYRHYSKRAVYAAEGGRPLEEAVRDFAIARKLEPSHPIISLGEAEFWLGLRPVYAIPALEDAMRRQPPVAGFFFHKMMERSGIDPRFGRALAELALSDPELQMKYFIAASPKEIAAQLKRIVADDPALGKWNRTQRRWLFSYWYAMGDRDALVAELLSRPDWREAGWRELCKHYCAMKDFEAALKIAKEDIPVPVLPRLFESRSAEELRAAFVLSPSDVSVGIRLYQAETLSDNLEGAVRALEKSTELPDCPDYVFYLLAEAREKMALFERAWESLEIYLRKNPNI